MYVCMYVCIYNNSIVNITVIHLCFLGEQDLFIYNYTFIYNTNTVFYSVLVLVFHLPTMRRNLEGGGWGEGEGEGEGGRGGRRRG